MGKQKIVISERDNIAAVFDDDVAVEFIIHRGDVLLGDVYLAQVENILPSIDAAFVNVGTERMGFLHSSDVQGRGDLKNRLQPKQNVVVQVMKEPTGHKGPRVTTNLALPGRFLVLMPESRGISISRKIADNKERARLKSTVSLMKPPGVGVIIRTEAENQAESEIQDDFETLIERWQHIVAMADTAKAPTLLYRDQDILYRVIREIVTEDVKEIVVDTAFGQQRANQLLQNWGVEHPVKVTLYNGQNSIMVGTGIDKEIKSALQTRVPMPSGGYLYIQQTEALTVVDVNSGKFTSLQSQSETIRLTNLEAAKEIARQLRLRNIGGMIIVDFIDMESRADQLTVLETFEMELSTDKSKPQIGQLSDLGLVEMTRHRQGQSLSEIFTRKCIACNGVGLAQEDFNWAPTGSERGGSASRSKLPIRQQQRGQQGPGGGQGQGGQGGQQGGQKNPLPKAGAQTLRKFLDPKSNTLPLREGFLQQSKNADDKQEKEATASMSLTELYRHRLVKACSMRFANIVKVGKVPLMINSVMVRINPKASDIFTLVDAIEGMGYTGEMEMDGDFDESMDGNGDGQGMDQPPMQQQGRGPRDHGHGGRSESREESDEASPVQLRLSDEAGDDVDTDAEPEVPVRRGRMALQERPQERPLVEMSEYEPLDDADELEPAIGQAVDEAPESAEAEAPRRRGRPPSRARVKPVADGEAPAAAPRRRGRPPKKATPKPDGE